MGMKFSKIPANTFEELQLNAGILLSEFDPTTATVAEKAIVGATSGGVKFSDTPSFEDFGSDIDNCPKNTKELKRITGRDIKMDGTYVTFNTARAKALAAAADIDSASGKITPRDTLKDADFTDLWWVGDYSDKNGETKGGFIAIHLKNALSTGGLSIQSGDKSKGQFAFSYEAHYSIQNQDEVPYEMFVKAGEDETATASEEPASSNEGTSA